MSEEIDTSRSRGSSSIGFVAISRFTVANGMEAEVRQAFEQRPHLVDNAEGFVGMQVICPRRRPEQFWLITHWRDEASFRAWHHSHTYHDAHKGIPRGLKLVPSETDIEFFDLVAS